MVFFSICNVYCYLQLRNYARKLMLVTLEIDITLLGIHT